MNAMNLLLASIFSRRMGNKRTPHPRGSRTVRVEALGEPPFGYFVLGKLRLAEC